LISTAHIFATIPACHITIVIVNLQGIVHVITTKTPRAILQSSEAETTCEARPVARGNVCRVDRVVIGQEIIDDIFKAANVDPFLVH
jgi:hypothetical protein